MKLSSYKETRKYLESFIKPVVFERITPRQARLDDPLLRMRHLLFLLGNPQNNFHSVLVGGTAGKGSTAYLISHILTTAGYKTGLAISPHLQKINERIQINGRPISDQKLIELVDSIVQTTELMRKSSFGEPSYFEILVGMAFLYFVKSKVDIAIVEVGLGGKYDATNTLNPLVSVLTNVSLDHTEILGKTVEKIAKEKVGIIKSTSQYPIVVTGVKQPSVIKIVEGKCKERRVQLYRLGKDFSFLLKKENTSGLVFDFISDEEKFFNVKLSMLGDYQLENASLALETILKLRKFGFRIDERGIRKSLETAFFPGRFELIEYKRQNVKYKILLDGAHNPSKMQAFIKTLQKLYPSQKKIFVIAFKKGKNIGEMLREILKAADTMVITKFSTKVDTGRNAANNIETINSCLLTLNTGDIDIYLEGNYKKALKKAFEIARSKKDNVIVVTGSLYLVGEVREWLLL